MIDEGKAVTLAKAKKEFEIRCCYWCHAELENEINNSFPNLRLFKCGFGWQLHHFMHQLERSDQLTLANAMIKRNSTYLEASGETMTAKENGLLNSLYQFASEPSTLEVEIQSRKQAGEKIRFASKRKLRKAAVAKFIEAFGSQCVDMKLVAAMIHPVMLLVTQIHQAAVALPAIRVSDTAQRHLALQNGRQYSAGTVRHNLGVNLPLPLQQPEDWHFLKSSPSAFAPDAATAKIAFINFHLPAQRRFGFAPLRDALADMSQVKVDRVAVQAGQLGDFSGFHIQTKQPRQQPKFGGRYARTPKIHFPPSHHWLYTIFVWA